MREIIADAELRRDMAALLRHALEKNHKLDPCQCSPCEKIAELAGADIIERAGGQDAVLCAAKHSDTGANDPQDCDWPFCGCDPKADKVIEAIQESGFTLVKDEDLLKDDKAGERHCGETAWVSVEERLPTESGNYLCFLDKSQLSQVTVSFYGDELFDADLENVGRVTYWASLPSPPTAEK